MMRFGNYLDSRQFRTTLLVAAIVLSVCILLLMYRAYSIYTSELPSFEQLHNIEQSVNTKVYDRNGVQLDEFYSENRVLTAYDDMPHHLKGMLLASEDQEFFSHWGLNLRRTIQVAANNLLKWEITAGASTISQQVARMLFLNQEQTLARKAKEALTAIKLERTYAKEEILEMYLNQHYFSRGAYGVAAASRMFFDKTVPELTVPEAAVLIGLLKGPNVNSPLNDMEKATNARNRVLYSYYNYGGLSREQYEQYRDEPIVLTPTQPNAGEAPYFTEYVRQYLLEKYGEDVLYSGGLRVFTTLDARLQQVAEQALYKRIDSLRADIARSYSLKNEEYTIMVPDTTTENPRDSIRTHKKIQGAFVAIDNATGDVLTMIGGRSFEESEFNRAVQGLRQPGSSFKPFIYTACIDNGFHASDIVDDNPIVLEIPGSKEWRPQNYDKRFYGPITLRDGLRLSRNLVAVRLLLKISPQEAIYYANKMGIATPLAPVPSLSLGASEVKLVEMVSAYSVFPNGGIRVPYRTILKVVDRYGAVLEDNSVVEKVEVLSDQTAFIMTDLMKSVVDAGTATRARSMGFSRPAGGKTGTTDNFCDNWFVGFTPQITAGVWLGFDDKTSLGASEDGGRNAVPPWTEYMLAAHDSLPIEDFNQPEGIVRRAACLETGELATDRCFLVRYEIFTINNQPTLTCSLHPSDNLYVPHGNENEYLPLDTTETERTIF